MVFMALLIVPIVLLISSIIKGQFTEMEINEQAKNTVSFPSQIFKISVLKSFLNLTSLRSTTLKCLKDSLNQNGAKALVVFLVILIAFSNVSYLSPSESEKKTIGWIKANTSSNEYILADDLNINFRAGRRSPFAEISIDLTDLGELTGEMFIEACYKYDVRVVVKTGRLFERLDTYDVFIEFLESNYVPISEGYTIYVRTTPLIVA